MVNDADHIVVKSEIEDRNHCEWICGDEHPLSAVDYSRMEPPVSFLRSSHEIAPRGGDGEDRGGTADAHIWSYTSQAYDLIK